MLNRLMTSRKVRGFLLALLIVSAIVAVVSVAVPLNRRKEAITTLGTQSLSEATSLALSLEYYSGTRIEALISYPDTTVFYQNLCTFLSRAKDTLSYDRVYLLYLGDEGKISYLADADCEETVQAGENYRAIGTVYEDERYTGRCTSILEAQFAGRQQATYVLEILDSNYITTYLPVKNSAGQTIAVLGIDAKLKYSDFTKYGPINFERLTTISGVLFLISLVLFVLCMDKGLSEEEKENRWRKRRGLPPKPVKKDKIVVDPLDDIDPNDYL